uniref:Uncharacterized protein n=1 Tax=Vitis vinifera TaxID=29760 RepID=F6HCQ9_VITVI
MEETCKLAVIGRPCKMCSNQVDFCKRNSEDQFQPCQKQKEKLKLKISCIKTEEFPLKLVQMMVLCHPASSEIAAWPMASTEKRLKQQTGNSSKENPFPLAQTNLWQAFSEAGAQTTIASLLGPKMAITTNQPQKELLALKLGVLEQRVLQPPLLPALIFPDPPHWRQ